jgi:hypothetical protein
MKDPSSEIVLGKGFFYGEFFLIMLIDIEIIGSELTYKMLEYDYS